MFEVTSADLLATVVTSFPSTFKRGSHNKGDWEGDMAFRESDLFKCIISDLENDSMPDRHISKSVEDLALTIVKKASGVLVSRTLPYHRQFFFMYNNAIASCVCPALIYYVDQANSIVGVASK